VGQGNSLLRQGLAHWQLFPNFTQAEPPPQTGELSESDDSSICPLQSLSLQSQSSGWA
jgi:hypothetical protein